MKISVSLPAEDIDFLDRFAEIEGIPSRSAAVHAAVRMLRSSRLGDAYAHAWEEWDSSRDAELWDAASGDGLS
jgi:Arc/MetJ-type ribon-helix-helix transcriptional regulator